MGDIIHNIFRVDQAVCWPDFTAPYSTKPSAELSSCFRLTLSCCSTTSTVDELALVHVMLSCLLCPETKSNVRPKQNSPEPADCIQGTIYRSRDTLGTVAAVLSLLQEFVHISLDAEAS